MPILEFKGKYHVYAHHLSVPFRPLVPDPKSSLASADESENLIIHGDNLHALKALLPRYADRVKIVYIDPPYNTGNERWIYNDNVNSPAMREWLKQQSPVDDEDLERHDKWLCMMWPRLQLLRELMAEDGIIFVSVDQNEQHHLKLMMDEIFGEHNFFALLTRRAMHTVRNSSKDFNLNADYVMVYGKDKSWFARDKSRYIRQLVDKSQNYPHDDHDGRGRYKLDPLHARNFYEPYEFAFENGVTWRPPSGSFPRYSPETLRCMERDGRISFSGGKPMAKRYLAEVQEGRPPDAILDDKVVRFNATGTSELRGIFGVASVFPQPKPVAFIRFLIEIVRRDDALVLDSFAGSGTTAHAVLDLNKADGGNRSFILVECEEYAKSVTAERVRRVAQGVPDAKDKTLRNGLGGSFTYCTLGKPITPEGLLTGEALPTYSALAAYLLHTATGISTGPDALAPMNNDGLFHEDDEADYYLLYKDDLEWLRSHDAVLNDQHALRIRARTRKKSHKKAIVFAAGKYLGQRELTDWGIVFCQLPWELHRAR